MSTLTPYANLLARKPYLVAIFITVLIVLWMASGQLQAVEDISQGATSGKDVKAVPVKVQVTSFNAVTTAKEINVYGRTEPDRQAKLKAEIKGLITKVLVQRGELVSTDQPLLQLARNDLDARHKQAQAQLIQRKIEHDGALSLNLKGYQGKANLAAAQANLASAQAVLENIRLQIRRTVILAPFDGVLNERYVEVGDYVGIGDEMALVVDLDPLVARADITEAQVHMLQTGQTVSASMLSKAIYEGKIRYISSLSQPGTNTFKIEVAIPNQGHKLRAGFSTQLSILLDEVAAIKVSPALLALDENGNVGVKTVVRSKVVFTPIEMVKSESDGMWLSGLGEQAQIISLGQGMVREGDVVDAVPASEQTSGGSL